MLSVIFFIIGMPEYGICHASNLSVARQTILLGIYTSGVTVLAGTDMVLRDAPAYPIARELSLMVEYGITPVQAIQTASGNPAKVLDRADEFGTIAPGLAADLLVVEGNAAEEIGAIWRRIRSFNKKVPNLVTRVWYFF